VRKISFGDFLLTGEIIIIGMAEAVHLAALFLGLSFARCSKILGGLTGAAFVFGAGFLLVRRRAAAKSGTAPRRGTERGRLFNKTYKFINFSIRVLPFFTTAPVFAACSSVYRVAPLKRFLLLQ